MCEYSLLSLGIVNETEAGMGAGGAVGVEMRNSLFIEMYLIHGQKSQVVLLNGKMPVCIFSCSPRLTAGGVSCLVLPPLLWGIEAWG